MKIKLILLLIIQVMLLVIPASALNHSQQKTTDLPDEFIIEDISSQDGGYHQSQKISIEWWYFDANLDNNLSVQIGFMLLSRKNIGFVFPGINIYENGTNVYHKRETYTLRNFEGSEQKPLIYFKNTPYIDGTIDEETGLANYKVTLSLGDAAVSLNFNSTMRGWKSDNWAIIMPNAVVSGTIKYNDMEISVKGEGYHEHKWNMPLTFAIENKGYYWGRIISENTCLVWTEIYTSLTEKRVLAVLNIGKSEYVKIEENDFNFRKLEYEIKLLEKIPIKFDLEIKNETIDYYVLINMLDFHHFKLFTKSYCRYNVKINGAVKIDGKIDEVIDSKGIMDHAKFSIFSL